MRQLMEADILAIRASSTQIGIVRLFEQIAFATSSNWVSECRACAPISKLVTDGLRLI
jgi:hypothetical protein